MSKLLGSVAVIVTGAAILVAAWFGYSAWTAARQDHAKASQVVATSVAASVAAAAGHDAVQEVQAEADTEAAGKALTQRNHDAIVSAPGAEAPVDPRLYAAALRAHCLRRSSLHDPACFVVRHPGS